MFYCQKQHKFPCYVDEYQMLFMCPFGKQFVPLARDDALNDDRIFSEVLSKIDVAILEGCEKNCILCDDTRNNQEFIDAILKCVDYIDNILEENKITNTSAGKFIGETCDAFRMIKRQMQIQNGE